MGSDASNAVRCPGCAGQLAATLDQAAASRHYVCQQCGGWVVAIAVLRHLLADGVAGRIWNGDEVGDGPEGPCPFCDHPMLARPAGAGTATICKNCQVVWLDPAALQTLPSAAPAPALQAAAPHEVRCDNCGAFVGSPYDEKCRYCGAALSPPTTVVVVPVGTTGPL